MNDHFNKGRLRVIHLWILLFLSMGLMAQDPLYISTYHSLGLYWSPIGGSYERHVTVEYRKKGTEEWNRGLSMVYHPVEGTTRDLASYRGSIVHLSPGTVYEVRLQLEGTPHSTCLLASTWSEDIPEGELIRIANMDSPLVIYDSGKPDAYRVYDGGGAVIDVKHQHNACILVNASYVILRNFTLLGAGDTTVLGGWPPIGAINLIGGNDIVIEGCDISDWGSRHPNPSVPEQGANYQSAILSRNQSLKRVTIQRNRMHHPTFQSNSWKDGLHPQGPQCIGFWNTEGNHVIRYNEMYSDENHYYNDVIGAGSNGSYRGFPGDDSDIYGNYISHCWDDGIEAEGANQNVRIWNNYISHSLMAIGNAATSIGPLYVWRNVSAISYSPPPNFSYGNFLKMGFAGSVNWMTGTMYIFHNTIYQEDDQGCAGLGGSRRVIRHCTSRNNILVVRDEVSHSIAISPEGENNDFDYDLYNKSVPLGSEQHGIAGVPVYVKGAGFDPASLSGIFQLDTTSAGVDAGELIPNFNDVYTGKAPDMGAHENGWVKMTYGLKASE